MEDCVTITWLPGADFKIYHIKFSDSNKLEYDIVKVDAISFKTPEEAQIHCDMMGYKVIECIDYSEDLRKELQQVERKTGLTFKI